MEDDWETFRKRYLDGLNLIFQSLNITIYGSYHPPQDLKLLNDLKDILIHEGYLSTRLVSDRKMRGDDALEISQECILFSDVNLFVFTRTGKRQGLIDEFSFFTSDERMIDKVQFGLVFDVESNEKSAIPDLSRSRALRYGVQVRTFHSRRQLKNSIAKDVY